MQNYSNETTLDVCDFIQLVAYLLDANVTSQNASLSYLKSFKAIQSKYSQPESILETDDNIKIVRLKDEMLIYADCPLEKKKNILKIMKDFD